MIDIDGVINLCDLQQGNKYAPLCFCLYRANEEYDEVICKKLIRAIITSNRPCDFIGIRMSSFTLRGWKQICKILPRFKSLYLIINDESTAKIKTVCKYLYNTRFINIRNDVDAGKIICPYLHNATHIGICGIKSNQFILEGLDHFNSVQFFDFLVYPNESSQNIYELMNKKMMKFMENSRVVSFVAYVPSGQENIYRQIIVSSKTYLRRAGIILITPQMVYNIDKWNKENADWISKCQHLTHLLFDVMSAPEIDMKSYYNMYRKALANAHNIVSIDLRIPEGCQGDHFKRNSNGLMNMLVGHSKIKSVYINGDFYATTFYYPKSVFNTIMDSTARKMSFVLGRNHLTSINNLIKICASKNVGNILSTDIVKYIFQFMCDPNDKTISEQDDTNQHLFSNPQNFLHSAFLSSQLYSFKYM